jgi:hypothetical protein
MQYTDEILAVIGGLYIILRAIVYITPTRRDNLVLDRVDKWMVRIKLVTGLSLSQGIKKHSPKQ